MPDGLDLPSLPGWAVVFVAVLCRVGTVVMLLPGLGEVDLPATVRAGLALAVSALLLPVVGDSVRNGLAGTDPVVVLAGELAIGILLGWLARLPALALGMGGAMISYMTGLTSVVQPDPALGGQSAVLARGLGLLAPVLILGTGLHAIALAALSGSYDVFPPGGALPAGPVAETVVAAVSGAFGLALRIAAPFLLMSVLLQAGLALLARLVPSLQLFSASAPGQILGGMALLAMLLSPLLSAWLEQVRLGWSALPGS